MKWEEWAADRHRTNIWSLMVPTDLVEEMLDRPGVVFRLLEDDGSPKIFNNADLAAMSRVAPEPFRVISRRIDLESRDRVYLGVSNDPEYWRRRKIAQETRRKQRLTETSGQS